MMKLFSVSILMNHHHHRNPTTTTSTRQFSNLVCRVRSIVRNHNEQHMVVYQNHHYHVIGTTNISSQQSYMSTQSDKPPSKSNKNSSPTESNTTSTSTSSNTIRKNRMLKTVIREGFVSLNQSAQVIQKNTETYKSIKKEAENEDMIITAEDINRTTEGHRLLDVAQESLDVIVRNKASGDTNSLLTIQGDPIVLLGVDVRPSNRHADLYWTIPAHLLFNQQYTLHQKVEIQNLMETRFEQQITLHAQRQQMNKPPTIVSQWFRRIYSILSTYYPPKIRLKAATPAMMQQVIDDEKEL